VDHFHHEVYGFCDYVGLYRKAVEIFPSGSHFVEVGSFLGKSAVFMAVEIINSGKRIKFDCIDHWKGSEEHCDNENIDTENLYEKFLENIQPVKGVINPVRAESIVASKLYKTNSRTERLRAIQKRENAMTVKTNFVYLSWPMTTS